MSSSGTADTPERSDDASSPLEGRDPLDSQAEVVDAPQVGDGALARQHPVFVYTMLRIAILVAVGAVFYLLGARGVWLILFAFLVSGVISAVALRRPREGAVLGFTSAYRGINARIDATTRAEDVDDLDDDLDEPGPATGAGGGAATS